MLGRSGVIRLTGGARDRLELLSAQSLKAATEEQGVHAEWRNGRLRLRVLDPQYRGFRGTFTVETRVEESGWLRIWGSIAWTPYVLIVGWFTLMAVVGASILAFGDGSGEALTFGWSVLSLFGVMAALGWALYPKQLAYQLAQLEGKLTSFT